MKHSSVIFFIFYSYFGSLESAILERGETTPSIVTWYVCIHGGGGSGMAVGIMSMFDPPTVV